jgi:hypothetical protein
MKAEFSLKKFDFIFDNGSVITFNVDSIFAFDGGFEYNNSSYRINKKSLFAQDFVILKNEREIGEIEISWQLHSKIKLQNSESVTKMFYLERVNKFVNRSHILTDNFNNEICIFKRKWNWNRFGNDCQITKGVGFNDDESRVDKVLLFMICIFIYKVIIKKNSAG